MFGINGAVATVGLGSAATLFTTGDFFFTGTLTVAVGITPSLAIATGGFDDDGSISLGPHQPVRWAFIS